VGYILHGEDIECLAETINKGNFLFIKTLNFDLRGYQEDENKRFKTEYITESHKIKGARIKLRQQMIEWERQREELVKSEFDYKAAEAKAKARMSRVYEKRDMAIKLRSS